MMGFLFFFVIKLCCVVLGVCNDLKENEKRKRAIFTRKTQVKRDAKKK